MAAVANKPPCTHREQKPIEACSRCGAWLRSFSATAPLCSPCARNVARARKRQLVEDLVRAHVAEWHR